MKRLIVCDIDGSLMPPSAGLTVSAPVQEKLIQLQQKGNTIVLNSARIFQGVYPLAKQIRMDEFGGYIISSNGCHIYEMAKEETIYTVSMNPEQVQWLWDFASSLNIGIGFSQPDYFVCSKMAEGFSLDHDNCDIDYIVTNHPEKYLKQEVVKCALAAETEVLAKAFPMIQEKLNAHTDFTAIASTGLLYDVINRGISKHGTTEKLLHLLGIGWDRVTSIGDGYSDVEIIRLSGLGCTLENAKRECKEVADMIVPSCYEEGCLVWLDALLDE